MSQQNKDKNAKLIFWGGVGTATGANIEFLYAGTKIMVDCGLLQGSFNDELKNFEPFKYDPSSFDFLLVTHAHMDHIGKIPKLVREGFGGKIISTKETLELARPMLLDALKVFRSRHRDKNLYEEKDIEKTMSLWEGCDYNQTINLGKDIKIDMQNAGHILGSAIINISYGSFDLNEVRKISFTGDLGNSPSPLLPDTEIPEGANYIVMESVYGDRNHESKEERRERFKGVIQEGIKRGGTIVIPAFSIERTQVMLYELNNMIEDGEIEKVPVYLDSPLAIKVTNIYKKYATDFKKEVQEEIKRGDNIFDFPGLNIVDGFEESKSVIKKGGPKIIIAGSGMSEGGRVLAHEADILDDHKNTLLLVGYQTLGSLGRALEDGKSEVKINGQKIKVRAKIETIKGYSSHKDSDNLVEFVEEASEGSTSPLTPLLAKERGTTQQHSLKKVFTIMGEPRSSLFLSQRIREYLDIEAIYPEPGKEYFLD